MYFIVESLPYRCPMGNIAILLTIMMPHRELLRFLIRN